MYLLTDSGGNIGDTIQSVLQHILDVTVAKKTLGNPGWSVTYKLEFCHESKSSISYGENWTKEEVIADFYKTQGLAIARENGYKLFKEV